ncbi:hypothetical protein Tco_1447508 [Tanacetum coccineum]
MSPSCLIFLFILLNGYLGRTLYWSCHHSLLPPVGVATVAPPSPTKPKKGKAALPLKSDRDEEGEEENGEDGGGLSQYGKELKKLHEDDEGANSIENISVESLPSIHHDQWQHDLLSNITTRRGASCHDDTAAILYSSDTIGASKDAYTYPPLPRVLLFFQASACSLSALHFLKFSKNSFKVLKLLENSVEVLKILENKLESMKILKNKLESLKLQENNR